MAFGRIFNKEVPELNTTSTADISFMLLIFFLVTTSMDSNFGLFHQLPRPVPPQMEKESKVIERRNIFELTITAEGKLLHGEEEVAMDKLCTTLEEFILNPHSNPMLAESPEKHIIMLRTDDEASYETYFKAKNQITIAYDQLRDKEAHKRFGRPYSQLNPRQLQSVDQTIPQRFTEQ